MAKVKKRIDIIVSYEITFSALDIERKHDEENVVTKEPLLDVAIERKERGVIEGRVGGALLKVKWKEREPSFLNAILILSA